MRLKKMKIICHVALQKSKQNWFGRRIHTHFVAPADSLQLTRTICRTEKICRLVMYPLDNVNYDTKRRVHSFDSRFEAPERVHSLLREQYKQD